MIRILLSLLFLAPFLSCSADEETLLYYAETSSSSKRIKLALEFKGIPFRLIHVDLLEEGEGFREINPMKKVPALVIDGLCLSQSVAILEYLEETRPCPSLLPTTSCERAVVRQLVQMVCCDIQPLQNGAVQDYVPDGAVWARFWIERGFKGIEIFLSQHSGAYSIGDNISMADFFLYPQILNARKYSVDLDQFPEISRIGQKLDKQFGKKNNVFTGGFI